MCILLVYDMFLPIFYTTEEQMEARPEKWSLPRPEKIHHVVEDFLTDWTAPSAHLLPLRRFLENCLQTDLRAFYAGLYKECMGSCKCALIAQW